MKLIYGNNINIDDIPIHGTLWIETKRISSNELGTEKYKGFSIQIEPSFYCYVAVDCGGSYLLNRMVGVEQQRSYVSRNYEKIEGNKLLIKVIQDNKNLIIIKIELLETMDELIAKLEKGYTDEN